MLVAWLVLTFYYVKGATFYIGVTLDRVGTPKSFTIRLPSASHCDAGFAGSVRL